MLHIPARVFGPMILDLGLALPDEACGLLIGHHSPGVAHRHGSRVVTLPGMAVVRFEMVANVAINPRTQFVLDRDEQQAVVDRARTDGLRPVAVVHSHPTAPPRPSGADMAEVCVLDAVIVSFGGPEPEARAWRWRGDSVWEEGMEILDFR